MARGAQEAAHGGGAGHSGPPRAALHPVSDREAEAGGFRLQVRVPQGGH